MKKINYVVIMSGTEETAAHLIAKKNNQSKNKKSSQIM